MFQYGFAMLPAAQAGSALPAFAPVVKEHGAPPVDATPATAVAALYELTVASAPPKRWQRASLGFVAQNDVYALYCATAMLRAVLMSVPFENLSNFTRANVYVY